MRLYGSIDRNYVSRIVMVSCEYIILLETKKFYILCVLLVTVGLQATSSRGLRYKNNVEIGIGSRSSRTRLTRRDLQNILAIGI
jgi:hypothetical protein